jgi:Macrophage migration inhibitory factor (MIF)
MSSCVINTLMSTYVANVVQVEDEEGFVTSLAAFLSERYQRELSSILITLEHSTCVFLGDASRSTYHLSLTAVPVWVQSTLNKRNAALLQGYLANTLGVPPQRGVVHFQAIPEANLAANGNTLLGEIECQDPSAATHRRKTSDPPFSNGTSRNRQSSGGRYSRKRGVLPSRRTRRAKVRLLRARKTLVYPRRRRLLHRPFQQPI